MTTLDPDTLERLRRQVPLRLDRRGQFFFEDDPVTHPGVRALFLRGLDLTPAGEPSLRVGEQWCYLQVEDCLLRVLGVRADANGAPVLRLDDGRELALDPATLWEEPGHGLRCSVPSQPSGRPLSVRFTNPALADLVPWLGDDDPVTLRLGDRRLPIPSQPQGA
ncbi:hypothetical protein [Nannocystis sp. SCPEA4]|uniref:hypothetical protein n=1 Tax=Nannocystis sp. SCPEA4 TaxID=2996787 RepID=UPI00226FA402|nr:hypothetical protein [Nannocystis sp. SCPEA4]MCY1063060.1 hypothetical protein [Nannocystis sp. SCPEA4]